MEWWIPLLIVFSILGFAGITILIIVIISINEKRGDYNDGGGQQDGAPETLTIYMSRSEKAGMRGERKVNSKLLPLLRNDEYLLNNILVPLNNGDTVEIDAIIISRKGIFCIETKNWAGIIRGSEDDEYWTQRYDDPSKTSKKHKNPIIQNERHCGVLDHIFHGHFTIEGAVIFVKQNAKYHIKSSSCYTISQFKNYYRSLGDYELTVEEVKQIYQKLSTYIPTQEQLEEHIERVRQIHS